MYHLIVLLNFNLKTDCQFRQNLTAKIGVNLVKADSDNIDTSQDYQSTFFFFFLFLTCTFVRQVYILFSKYHSISLYHFTVLIFIILAKKIFLY